MKQTTKTGRRNQVTTYVPIADNIYHDGSSYRVRVRVQGETVSKSFSNKRKAITFRNQLWRAQYCKTYGYQDLGMTLLRSFFIIMFWYDKKNI